MYARIKENMEVSMRASEIMSLLKNHIKAKFHQKAEIEDIGEMADQILENDILEQRAENNRLYRCNLRVV